MNQGRNNVPPEGPGPPWRGSRARDRCTRPEAAFLSLGDEPPDVLPVVTAVPICFFGRFRGPLFKAENKDLKS